MMVRPGELVRGLCAVAAHYRTGAGLAESTTGSITGDPVFTDPSVDKFHWQVASPAPSCAFCARRAISRGLLSEHLLPRLACP